jgi:hypothetical protein
MRHAFLNAFVCTGKLFEMRKAAKKTVSPAGAMHHDVADWESFAHFPTEFM